MNDFLFVLLVGFILGAIVGALVLGQVVGWWAREMGAAYVLKHLEVTKP